MSLECDSNSIAAASQCFVDQIDPGSQTAAQIALLAEIAGDTSTPEQLMAAAACLAAKIPKDMQKAVQAYLLCQQVTGATCTPEALVLAARCLDSIAAGDQAGVHTRLMCEWSNAGGGLCSDPVVVDWLARLAADFQPTPSAATIAAVCDFCEALRTDGIMDKMLVVNPIIPDSFLAMRYPLIYQAGNGNSPFINHNFVAADLTVDGLIGDGASKYFDTGFVPDVNWAGIGSAGLSIYESEASPFVGSTEVEIGSESGAGESLWMATYDTTFVSGISVCWNGLTGVFFLPVASTPAFYSLNRTGVAFMKLYQGNGMIPFNDLGATNIANQAGSVPPSFSSFLMAYHEGPPASPASFSGKRVSFSAIHEGLTTAEAQDFFNAVQDLRIALGGGFV